MIQQIQADESSVNNNSNATFDFGANNCVWQNPDWEEKVGMKGLHEE